MTRRWKFDALAQELKDVEHMPQPYARFCHNLIRKHKLKTVLEFGTHVGKSAAFLANAVGPKGRVITMEKRTNCTEAEERMARLDLRNVQVVRHPSGCEWVCKYFVERQMSFDLAYIDGCHDFKHVLADFALAKRLVRPGGWIVFDDIPWTHKSMFARRPEAHERFVKNQGIDYVEAQQVKAVWDHIVTRDPDVANIVHHSKWFAAVQLGMPKRQRTVLARVRHPIQPMSKLPVIFSIFDKADLLPHFVHHYAQQGVTEFHCCLYSQKLDHFVRKTAQDAGVNLTIHPNTEVFDHIGRHDAKLHNRVRTESIADGGWYVIADLDEFHRVGIRTLAQTATMAEHEGAQVVMGRLIDRVTKLGALPEAIDSRPIDDQFPYTAWLTSKVTRGNDAKILLARKEVPIVSGHHSPPDGFDSVWRIRGQAHHFKWWGDLIDRYRQRRDEMEVHQTPEVLESERLLEYLDKHNGIDMKDFTIHPFINTWV